VDGGDGGAQAVGDGVAGGELGLQAESGLALFLGADAEIDDDPGHGIPPVSCGGTVLALPADTVGGVVA